MRVGKIVVLSAFVLSACGIGGGSLPDLPDDIPPPPSTRSDYDSASAAPCSYDEPLLGRYCGFGVRRTGTDAATVYITRPQGGTRELVLNGTGWSTRGASIEAVKLSDGTSLTVDGNEFYQISEPLVLGK
jgi:hypothetical protein